MSDTPNLRNFKEFRKELLAAFGVERSLVEVDDEEFKGGLLEGLGVTYLDEDLKNFEKYRAKLIEGVLNYSGGGGGSSDYEILEFVFNPDSQTYDSVMTAYEIYNSSKTNYAIVLTDNAFDGAYVLGKPYVMIYKEYEDEQYTFTFNLAEYSSALVQKFTIQFMGLEPNEPLIISTGAPK